MTRHTIAVLAAILSLWTVAQVFWVEQDRRMPDWETARDIGAIEDWAGQPPPEGQSSVDRLRAVTLGKSGEYPALYPAVSGAAARSLSVTDWNGPAPAYLALGWAWLALLGTFLMGRSAGTNTTGLLATGLLASSPLYTALAREPLMESGMTALVAIAVAFGFSAVRDAGQQRRLGSWVLVGLFAGLALLTKQTAAFVLLPLALVLLFINGSRWIGPLAALVVCLAVCGPWYLQDWVAGEGYLSRSAQANPDAVGPLHQLLFYPLAFVQHAWPPAALALLGLFGGLAVKEGLGRRTGRWSIPLAVFLGSLFFLIVIPKKYPRLLLPLLPLAATVGALWLERWPLRLRSAILLVAGLGFLSNLTTIPGASPVFGASHFGLKQIDERCQQEWIRPPDPIGFDWGRLVDLVEEAGGAGQPYRIGSPSWPTPPCAYQTTLHLGEHLQVRLRRADKESSVMTEGGWTIEEGWREGPPEVLITAEPLSCATLQSFCESFETITEVGVVSFNHPEWNVETYVYRVTQAAVPEL